MEGQNPTTGSSDSHLGKQDRRRDMRLMTHGIKSHPHQRPLCARRPQQSRPRGEEKGKFPREIIFYF
jgi:hypothetical protein